MFVAEISTIQGASLTGFSTASGTLLFPSKFDFKISCGLCYWFRSPEYTKQTWGLMGVPGGVLGGVWNITTSGSQTFSFLTGNSSVPKWSLFIPLNNIHKTDWFYASGVPFFISKSLFGKILDMIKNISHHFPISISVLKSCFYYCNFFGKFWARNLKQGRIFLLRSNMLLQLFIFAKKRHFAAPLKEKKTIVDS